VLYTYMLLILVSYERGVLFAYRLCVYIYIMFLSNARSHLQLDMGSSISSTSTTQTFTGGQSSSRESGSSSGKFYTCTHLLSLLQDTSYVYVSISCTTSFYHHQQVNFYLRLKCCRCHGKI